jgi:phosphoribosylanthranilate isomerase
MSGRVAPQAPATTVQAKICGLRDSSAIRAAVDGGAGFIGFVFAPSRRQITPATAAGLIREIRAAYGAAAPLCVGLFVNETPEEMARISDECGLDLVQLCGDEAPSVGLLLALGRPVIRVLRPAADTPPDAVLRLTAAWHAVASAADGQGIPVAGPWGSRLLIGLDANHSGLYGGTGQTGDWTLAAALAQQMPLMLAGGLTPANVRAACRTVRPWLADVSSGVELAGAKDPGLIRAFLTAVRET